MHYFAVILFILFQLTASSYAQTGEDPELDSLIALYHGMSDNDTAKVRVCSEIGRLHYSVDSTIMWADRLFELGNLHHNYFYINEAYSYLDWAYYFSGNFSMAIDCCMKGIHLCDSINKPSLKAYHYYMLGSIYSMRKMFRESEQFEKKALDIYLQDRDTSRIINSYRELEFLYIEMGAFDLAEKALNNCLHLDSLSHNDEDMYLTLVSLAELYNTRFFHTINTDSINYISKSLDFLEKADRIDSRDMNDERIFNTLLVQCLFYQSRYYKYSGARLSKIVDSTFRICNKLTRFNELIQSSSSLRSMSTSWVYYHILNKDYSRAYNMLDSLRCDSVIDKTITYRLFVDYYKAVGNRDSIVKYIQLYSYYFVKSYSPADIASFTQNYDKIEFEEVLSAQRREREAEKQSEKLRRNVFWLLFGFVSMVAVFVGHNLIRKRRYLREMNEKNQQITDSIQYASLIQHASLPKGEAMNMLFNDYFLIYRPLHIVAGDFYWASQIGRFKLLVCADCTGHGVPGAMLSMLGVSLLHEVSANLVENFTASEILNNLRGKFMKALGQVKKADIDILHTNMDGIDMALVVIDTADMQLQYAGAYRPLWLWRDGEIIQYKPDKMPIGIYLGEDRYFTNHVIDIRKNDVLYMFSDGIPDQFGYTDDTRTSCRHFSTKKLLGLLTEIGSLPMSEQKSIIENTVDAWKNGYKQLDDNILIGVRI